MSLSLAVISSNQDRNLGVIPGYSECGGMRILAEAVVKAAADRGAVARHFAPDLESRDDVQYEALYETFPMARKWLDQQPGVTLVMHLHSDAGGGSHSGYCYSTKRPVSTLLGKALAERCQRVLQTARVLGFDRTDWMWDRYAGDHAAVYLEVCAHDVETDLRALYASVDPLASELVDGTLAWVGGVAPPAADPTAELRAKVEQLEADNAKLRAVLRDAYVRLGAIL